MIFLSNRTGKFKLLDLQGDPPPPKFPRLVGYLDLPMRKTLRVAGLLTVMIFFKSKKFAACKIKDEKVDTILYFVMVFNLMKIIHPIESEKYFRAKRNLIATHNIWFVTNRFKYKFFSVITQLSVTVTLLYFC